jgi:hypothetical protein
MSFIAVALGHRIGIRTRNVCNLMLIYIKPIVLSGTLSLKQSLFLGRGAGLFVVQCICLCNV